ncbi:rRNA large subunit methyltransferase [Lacticaseibacillus paracasei subsp. paracasei Lpp7]|uniref:Ribosomal RNA large subunit methyltransferase H n=1 Tax=Lacticaseibacillus paracasei subsp. paracasei Lpp7 TaxID=1256200 RepID=A0A8E0IHK2_LACPA|nr:rRNA large subunit methyltransferase [Lacticaseibacillus paracasei subsp. paracasei Lpp7]
MNIKIIGVGKLKEKYFRDGIAEYLKRMDKFAKVKIVEVADEKAPENLSEAEMADVKVKEGDRILGKIKDKEWVIALAIEGKQRPSEVFAKEIADLGTYGHSDITFVIGGSLGLSPAVMKRANDTLSFGKLTMPHQLMRLVLMEQIYRAFMINIGSPIINRDNVRIADWFLVDSRVSQSAGFDIDKKKRGFEHDTRNIFRPS